MKGPPFIQNPVPECSSWQNRADTTLSPSDKFKFTLLKIKSGWSNSFALFFACHNKWENNIFGYTRISLLSNDSSASHHIYPLLIITLIKMPNHHNCWSSPSGHDLIKKCQLSFKRMILLIVVIVFLSSTSLIPEVDSASSIFRTWKFHNCSFDNVDGCARIVMLYGARDLVLPDNERDMKPHCESVLCNFFSLSLSLILPLSHLILLPNLEEGLLTNSRLELQLLFFPIMLLMFSTSITHVCLDYFFEYHKISCR